MCLTLVNSLTGVTGDSGTRRRPHRSEERRTTNKTTGVTLMARSTEKALKRSVTEVAGPSVRTIRSATKGVNSPRPARPRMICSDGFGR